MKNKLYPKVIVIGIIYLFFGASVVSGINFEFEKDIKIIRDLNGDTLTFYPTDDTQIHQTHPDQNFGHWPLMNCRNAGGGSIWEYSDLLKFDLSSLTSDMNIISCNLYVYYFEWYENNPAGRSLDLYRITYDWDENIVTFNTQPTYAAQSTSFDNVPSSPGWMEWDVLSDVEDFISGSTINYGWKISDENYWGGPDIPRATFRTKEHETFKPYVEVITNEPPLETMISGEVNGKMREPYDYSFTTYDPDNNQIQLWVEWGDGTSANWIGPFDSGEKVNLTHTWSDRGTYKIKAKAKDTYGAESEWAELKVTMPKNKPFVFNFPLLNWLFERFPNAFPILRYIKGLA